MKKILIVDGNDKTRAALISELRAYKKFRISSTDCAKTAAKFVRTQHIDFLVTELNLPEINGFKLILYVKKYSPETTSIAVSDFFSNPLIEKLKALGVAHYFKKPVNIESLSDVLFGRSENQPLSNIDGVALSSFLQLMSLEQKTCTLTLGSGGKQGTIYCMKGEVIGAQTGGLHGSEAFYKIMEWANPNIKIANGCENVTRQINVPLMHLLMESQQLIDESGEEGSRPVDSPGEQEEVHSLAQGELTLEFDRDDPDLKQLDSMLSKAPGISDYDIFFEESQLTDPSTLNDSFAVSPSEYYSLGNTISSFVGGQLKYSKINQTSRSSHLIGKYDQFFIRARLNPGTEPGDILRMKTATIDVMSEDK